MAQAQRTVASGSRAMKSEVKALQLTFADVATASSRAWRVFLGGAAIIGTAKTIISVTDAFKSLQAQLRLATSQYGSFEQANKDVQAIAARSRSDLLSTAQLYSTLQRNADQFGGSQQQVARITETVTKAFKISGASADEASNATRQLVQAFQSGRLQGDEFRSMMENAPRLARLLADSLGITVGQLRQMSKEGKLTADVLARAFSDARFTDTIDEEFRQLPVTFDQAMNQVYNAAVLTFGEFDQGGQFSTALSNFITGGTQGFADLSDAAYRWGAETRGLLDGLDAVKAGIGSMSSEGIRGMLGIEDATISLRGTIGSLLGVIDGVANAFANLYNAPGNLLRLIGGGKAINNPSNLAGGFFSAYDKAQTDATRRKIMGRGANDVFTELGLGRKVPAFHPAAIGGAKGGGGGGRAKRAPADRSADVEAQFDQEMRQADMEILRARQDLTHNSEARAAVEIQLLALEQENEKAALADKVRRAQKDFADGRITKSALDQVEADAKILDSKNAEVTRLKTQAILDDVTHQRAEDAANLEQTNFDIQRDALQAQEDLATTASERRDIELRLLDLSYRQEKARLDAVIADETSSEAAKEEARRRLAGLNAGFAAKQAGVMQSTAGPLEQWARSIPKTAAEINEAFQSIETQGLDSLSDAIAGVVTGTQSLADAFKDVANSIISDIIRMTVRMLIFKAISGIMGGGSTGGGDFSAFETSSGGGGFGIPGFASGGAFTIMGNRGVDKNQLSLNGLPIANVSYGERLSIANDNGGGGGGGVGRVIVEINDPLLQARIAEGANIQIVRAAPALRADTMRAIGERNRRR